jgi:hypothetical protein
MAVIVPTGALPMECVETDLQEVGVDHYFYALLSTVW